MAVPVRSKCDLLKLLQDTGEQVDAYLKLASEGKGLQEAKTFWRFVTWSLLPVFESLPVEMWEVPNPGAYKMRLPALKKLLGDLHWVLGEQFRQPKFNPKWEMREIDALSHKMELVAGEIVGQRSALDALRAEIAQLRAERAPGLDRGFFDCFRGKDEIEVSAGGAESLTGGQTLNSVARLRFDAHQPS